LAAHLLQQRAFSAHVAELDQIINELDHAGTP
jgi:hypothetical protein